VTTSDRLTFATETLANITAAYWASVAQSAGTQTPSRGLSFTGRIAGSRDVYVYALSFSTEAYSLVGSIATGRLAASAFAGQVSAYCCGGNSTIEENIIDRLVLSTDALSVLSATLPQTRAYAASIQSPFDGFSMSGFAAGSPDVTTAAELSFSTETAVTLNSVTGTGRSAGSGLGTANKGYVAGGDASGTPSAEIDGLVFLPRTTTNPAAALSVARYWAGLGVFPQPIIGLGESLSLDMQFNAAYATPQSQTGHARIAGGVNGGGYQSTIDSFAFSTEAISSAGSISVGSRSDLAGFASSTICYFAGGLNSSAQPQYSVLKSDAYNTSTVGTFATTMTDVTGVSSSSHGYMCGTAAFSSEIEKMQFSNESMANPSATMATARNYKPVGVNSVTTGYVGAGRIVGSGYTTSIDSITFSSDTTATVSATLQSNREAGWGAQHRGTVGLFMGGDYSGTKKSDIDALAFSTETVSTLTASLSVARSGLAGLSGARFAYGAGGYSTTYSSEIDGVNFSTVVATNPSATLSAARTGVGGASIDSAISLAESGHDGTVQATSQSGSVAESGSAADSPTGAQQQSATGSEATSVASSHSAIMTSPVSAPEAASAVAAIDSGFVFTVANTNALTALGDQDSGVTFPVAILSSATSGTSDSALVTFAGAASETASATSVESVLAAFAPAIVEAVSSQSSQSVVAVFVVVSDEAASPLDSKDAGNAVPSMATEAASPSWSATVVPVYVGAGAEAGNAQEAIDAYANMVASRSEAATALSVIDVEFAANVSIGEASSPSDSSVAGLAYVSSAAAAATGTTEQSAIADFAVDISESVISLALQSQGGGGDVIANEYLLATSTQSAIAEFVVSAAESATASALIDSEFYNVVLDLSVTAQANAESTQSGATVVVRVADELGTALDFSSLQKLMYATGEALVAATDSTDRALFLFSDSAEGASAETQPASDVVFSAWLSESVVADTVSSAIGTFPVGIAEIVAAVANIQGWLKSASFRAKAYVTSYRNVVFCRVITDALHVHAADGNARANAEHRHVSANAADDESRVSTSNDGARVK
jgi:hypothetical protein